MRSHYRAPAVDPTTPGLVRPPPERCGLRLSMTTLFISKCAGAQTCPDDMTNYPLTSCSTNPPRICGALERAAEEPTGATVEPCAPKDLNRWRPSRVLCHNWRRPQKR